MRKSGTYRHSENINLAVSGTHADINDHGSCDVIADDGGAQIGSTACTRALREMQQAVE